MPLPPQYFKATNQATRGVLTACIIHCKVKNPDCHLVFLGRIYDALKVRSHSNFLEAWFEVGAFPTEDDPGSSVTLGLSLF